MSAEAKNIERIVQSIEQHDANCKEKAKAVLLNPFEHQRLGWDEVKVQGRSVPIRPDDSLGTGRLRIVCDGYHGPKKEVEEEAAVEAPSPAERELVPAGVPDVDEAERLTGFKLNPRQKEFWKAAQDGSLKRYVLFRGCRGRIR